MEFMIYEKKDTTALITINRPKALNAFNSQMLDELTEEGISGEPDLICQRVASMSCKAAVKGNHDMSPAEADALIDQLLKLENPYHCPQ